MRTTRALAALTLATGLLLAGCGDGNDTGIDKQNSSRTDHNDADVTFASDMIQHHAQALAMVDLANGRDLNPEFQQLVESIRATQAPEIETMTDWLTEWDEPIPATVNDHVNADEDHGEHESGDTDGGDDTGMDMPGMVDEEAMGQLEAASDAEFQDMFLTMMIEHHEGAIEMAQAEQKDGQYTPAIALAEQIETGQSAEIDTMQGPLS